MKNDQIFADRNYVNGSGRSERHVLAVGTDVPVRWLGYHDTEPKGEAGVCYIDVRLGKTFYGHRSGKRPQTMYLSAFASWAQSVVPKGEEAPVHIPADVPHPRKGMV